MLLFKPDSSYTMELLDTSCGAQWRGMIGHPLAELFHVSPKVTDIA
jgi:hypothetical protein